LNSLKYTPLPGENYYDASGEDHKDSAYDLSVTAPSTSSTTNTTTHSALNNLKSDASESATGPVSLKVEKPLEMPKFPAHNGSTSKKMRHMVNVDDKSHDDDNSFYLPLRHNNDPDHMEFDEGKFPFYAIL
jgi:hypothetical protein